MAPLDKKSSELMVRQFVALYARDDQEVAIDIFKQTNRVALPVYWFLNGRFALASSLLTIWWTLSRKKIQRISRNSEVQKHWKNRISKFPWWKWSAREPDGWSSFFLGEMLTASAMGYFNNELNKAVVLALFVPLIISSGGNSRITGLQLWLFAMALGEATLC